MNVRGSAHRFIPGEPTGTMCLRCELPYFHAAHNYVRWEVKSLPWNQKRPWFSYHPDRKLEWHATWAEGMARVCEDLREKQE